MFQSESSAGSGGLAVPIAVEGIIGSKGPYAPGSEAVFTAGAITGGGDVQYEWFLQWNDYFERAGRMTRLEDGAGVRVRLPDTPGRYRLFVYVSDANGAVGTASLPIDVSAPGPVAPPKTPPPVAALSRLWN